MNVLVDTSVWSLALRRSAAHQSEETAGLVELIREGRVAMIGAIRQEILSGVRAPEHYRKLRDRLRAFGDEVLDEADNEEAATWFNRWRERATGFQYGLLDLRREDAAPARDLDDRRGFRRVREDSRIRAARRAVTGDCQARRCASYCSGQPLGVNLRPFKPRQSLGRQDRGRGTSPRSRATTVQLARRQVRCWFRRRSQRARRAPHRVSLRDL